MSFKVEDVLVQLHICILLLKTRACAPGDLANLTLCSKAFLSTRKQLFCEKFTLRLKNREDYEKAISLGARRVVVSGYWRLSYGFDFSWISDNLWLFICEV